MPLHAVPVLFVLSVAWRTSHAMPSAGSPTNEGMISSADGVLRPSRSVQNATLKVGQISADGVGVAVGDLLVLLQVQTASWEPDFSVNSISSLMSGQVGLLQYPLASCG